MKTILAMLCVLWLALGGAGGQTTPAPSAGNPGLADVKKQFAATLNELQRQDLEAAKLRRQSYLAALGKLEETLQLAGNQLSAILAVHTEQERFAQSGDIPDSALAGNLPALRKLQDAWRAQSAAVPRDQAQKFVAGSQRYLQNLALLQRDLTARHDPHGAAEVNAEKERLLTNNRLLEASALLRTPPPAAPLREEVKSASAIVTNKPPESKLVIVKAVYGVLTDGKKKIVTQKVAAMVKDNRLSVGANNGNFGDPAQGHVKKLRVEYTLNGVTKTKTVDENQTLTISATGR